MKKIRATIGYTSSSHSKTRHNRTPKSHSKPKFNKNNEDFKRLSILYRGQTDFGSSFAEKKKRKYIDNSQVNHFIRTLYSYLHNSDYPHPIKKNSLKIPSLNSFS